MVCIVVDEKGKIRNFKSIERVEKYLMRREGVYFLIEPAPTFLGVSVIEAKNGDVRQIKSSTITKSS